MYKLSILIPTTQSRSEVIKPLLAEIKRQMSHYPNEVELLLDECEVSNVGKKRNDLLHEASGEWVVFIDSDDDISPDYISKIMVALESNPDCVGISGIITTDGRREMQWHISKDYGFWHQKGQVYLRTPNHISPIRRSIALLAMFPEVKFAEDLEFSKRVFPLLKTEVKVEGNIYHYKYISGKY